MMTGVKDDQSLAISLETSHRGVYVGRETHYCNYSDEPQHDSRGWNRWFQFSYPPGGPQVTPKSARSTTCPVKLAAVCCANQTAAGMIASGCAMGICAVPGQSPRRFIQVSTRPGLSTLTATSAGRTSSARFRNMRSRAALLIE